jgi:type VI secretion system protein ImpJ
MHLAQHHFQAQSLYFESLTAFVVSRVFFKAYGVVGCELDAEALRNGTVVLSHARGVMPDGLVFRFPEDSSPPPLEIRRLVSPTHDSYIVSLAIPQYRPREANCALEPDDGSGRLRFSAAMEEFRDEITGDDGREIAVAKKNFRLVLETQDLTDMVTLPVARIRRDGEGNYVYDAAFIPPCIQIGASPRLMGLLGRVVEILEAKGAVLQAGRAGAGSTVDYASREVAGFWLSHAVNSSIAPLRHLLHARTAHPEQLYGELSRLAGALCTFSINSDPRLLPLYDHDAMGGCFDALDQHIREHLEIILPTRGITIPLPPVARFFYGAAVTDPRAMARSHWYLGVRSSAASALMAADIPRLVKVCSGDDDIRKLVERALPGAPLEYVPSPPPEISPRIGTQYFRIGRTMRAPDGSTHPVPCWTRITQVKTVGVYVPATIPDVELELCIVPEGG